MVENFEKIFFIDVETVPQAYTYADLDLDSQKHFSKKMRFVLDKNEQSVDDIYSERAGILAEFNRIICISVCILSTNQHGALEHKTTSYFGHDEKQLLTEFGQLLNENVKSYPYLCAHNGKEFDFPVICRRMLINGLTLPKQLNVAGKKPWETSFIDTLELWKFGDYKHYTSLDLLAHVFGIPSPKDDINGADIARVYYEEKDLDRIVTYCTKDALTLAKVYLKMAHNKTLD